VKDMRAGKEEKVPLEGIARFIAASRGKEGWG